MTPTEVANLESIRLAVVDPVADIANAGFGEVIECVPGFGQTGDEPADRPPA